MIQYTFLERHEVEDILSSFSIGDFVSFKLLSGGSENTNYLIDANKGKYVLTICEQKTMKSAGAMVDVLIHLDKNHFQTSKVLFNTNEEAIVNWRDKPVMVKRFIQGKVLKHFSPVMLNLIGREIGKLHKIEAPEYLPKQISYGKEQFEKVKLYAANSDFQHWLDEVLDYISLYLDTNLPKALIHSDVFDSNVIVSDDESEVTIFDFEEATYYYRVFDIGMAIIGTCSEDGKVISQKAVHLLKGYLKEIQLTKDELVALKAFTVYAGAAMTFWRHINFNYTKPDPNMANHYLGLKVLADDVWHKPDDCFTSLLGE